MKHLLLFVLLVGTISCEKDNNVIPELTDLNPKVTIIKSPGSDANHFQTTKIGYEGEFISCIKRSFENESADNIDSVRFFYTENQIDSAIRIDSHLNLATSVLLHDTIAYYFVYDPYGHIVEIKEKSRVFANDTAHYYFAYVNDKLSTLKTLFDGDSIIYNANEASEIRNYQMLYLGSNKFGELNNKLTIKSTNNRPNPYFLICDKLGFPFFRTFYDISRREYNGECIVDYEYENPQFGNTMGKYLYKYDNKGRVVAMWNKNYPELKEIVEYY